MIIAKLCGTALLAGCGFVLALIRRRERSACAAYLHALELALLRMRTAIVERLEPLPDIIEREANDHESAAKDFFARISGTWRVCGKLGTAISSAVDAAELPEAAC